jgi:hypothetical protein
LSSLTELRREGGVFSSTIWSKSSMLLKGILGVHLILYA